MERLGTSKPVIHMAQTKTMRSGSSGSLNFVSRSSVTMRRRCGAMSSPFSLEVLDLVLRLRDDDRHVGRLHEGDRALAGARARPR